MRHILLLLTTILWAAQPAMPQETVWKGSVVSHATGMPIAGAIVTAESDARYSAMSDTKGTFEITLPPHIGTLTVEATDHKSVTLHLPAEGTAIKVLMHPAIVPSAAATALTIEDNLATKQAEGLRTIRGSSNPAQGAMLMLGGWHSLNSNATPLIVVDGVVLDQQNDRPLLHQGYLNNVLSAISPDDIEKVSILHDATALYGAKGGGGVILIETKRAKSMATRIDVNLRSGMEWMPRLPQMMNAAQYRSYAADILGNATTTPEFLSNQTADKQLYAMYHNDTDWSRAVYQKALTQYYGINVQGGDEIAKYNLGINYSNAESTLKGNDFDRLSLRFNTDVNIVDPLTVQLDVGYSNTGRNLRDDGIHSGDNFAPSALALIKSPLLNSHMADKSGNFTASLADYDVFGISNPLAIIEGGDASNKNSLSYNLFFMNIRPEWRLGKHLTISEQVSYVLNNVTERYFMPDEGVPTIVNGTDAAINNQSRAYSSKQTSLMSDTRLTWSARHGLHRMKTVGGMRYMSDTYNNDGISASNTVSDKMPNITATMDNRQVTGCYEQWKSAALYLHADYSYTDRYDLTASLTGETSTRYGRNAQGGITVGDYVWAMFPSLQTRWNVSAEPFFRKTKAISQLAITAGIDQSGNDRIPPYASRSYFTTTPFINGTAGISLGHIGNDKLRWETTTRLHVGAQMRAFEERWGIAVKATKSYTDNLLVWKPLDGISGLSRYLCNEGQLENISYSLHTDIRLLSRRNLSWDIYGTANSYANRLTALPEGNKSFTTDYMEGQLLTAIDNPIAVFYGYRTNGVFATTEAAQEAAIRMGSERGYQLQAGDPVYIDTNDDHIINEEDRQIIGDPNPNLFGSFGTTLTWRGFTFDASFTYNIGGDIYNYARRVLEQGGSYHNQTTAMLRRWVREGQQTDVPRANSASKTSGYGFTDRWIEDGSYMKLRSVSVSYHKPLALSFMQGFTVWVAANNMFTLTRYLGADPEVSCSRNALYQGIDCGLLGEGRSVTAGIKINL